MRRIARSIPRRNSSRAYIVDYAFMMREPTGEVRVLHDRHVEGLFPRAVWLDALRRAGLTASSDLDAFGRDVFVARWRS